MSSKIFEKISHIFKKSKIDVSVIVPVYNVEEYIIECLDSLENQTLQNIQVIIIDDGSTDKSSELAENYAKSHSKFEYYKIENQGLGHARNYAMQFVKGKYFAFVDSDDIVAPDAYENMLDALKKQNAQFAICNVARFNSQSTKISALHEKVFNTLDKSANILSDHSLIYDTTSWNKLISKSFWDKHQFSFPEGILYEDIPVTIPMHCLAEKVAVVNKVGYFWRVRDGVSTSITQNTHNMQNLYDRIAVIKMVDEFFKKNISTPELELAKQIKHLEIDLSIFINICNNVPKEQAYEIFDIIKDYINSNISADALKQISLISKQKYQFILENNLEGLINVLENQSADYVNAPIEEKDGKFYIECSDSVFPIQDRDVTNELREVAPKKNINDIVVNKTSFDVLAQLYIPRVNIADSSQQQIEAYLLNDKTGYITPLKTTPFENHLLTSTKGFVYNSVTDKTTQYNYDGTGFNISLNLEEIEINDNNAGTNHIVIKYKNRVSSGKLYLSGATKGIRTKISDNTIIFNDKVLRLGMSMFDEIIVELSKETNFVEKTTFKNNELQIHLNAPAKRIFAEDDKGNVIDFKTNGNITFSCPVKEFVCDSNYKFFIIKQNNEKGFLTRKTKNVSIKDCTDDVLILISNKTLRLEATVLPSCSKITEITKDDAVINISTQTFGSKLHRTNAVYANIVVDDEMSKTVVSLAKSKCEEVNGQFVCNFKINFADEEITKNLFDSFRLVHIEYTLKNGNVVREPLCTPKYFKHSVSFETLALELYRVEGFLVRLRAKLLWKPEENTKQKRQALVAANYEEYRKLPINPKRIIFESMWGTKYSCSPQHLYEFIDKNYPEYECIWSFEDPRTPINGNGKRVRRGTLEYFYYLATAKYFVNNVNFEDAYEKREGQIEIQTMHGTPLKTMGFDVENDFVTEAQKENYIRRNSRWNYLVVQGNFMAEKAFTCFGCETPLLKTGYPRTDTLFENNTEEKIKALKEKLNLPLDKKIILYVPTWRVKNKFDMQLDIEEMRMQLSDDYILLIRLHHFSASGYKIPADDQFVFDFNHYHTVEDLYLLCDILITDYSSVMFDYGVLKKPMMFFTYDLREYADNLRGMYFDIEKEAPGPMVYTSDELIEAISNIDEEMEKCKDRIDIFNNKYINFEGPESCNKIFETVFDPQNDLK